MKKLGFKKLGFKKLGFKKLGIKKIGVIIGVILFSLGLFNRTEAYVMLPYQDIDYDYFELYLRYDTSTLTADSSSNDMLVFPHIGLDFSFKNIAYNMRILPYVIEDEASGIKDEVSWTIHNIHWQLFKDFDYGLFRLLKPGIQVGVTNIGLPKSALSEAQIFNAYLASYYLVSEFHMFNNPRLNLYWGINFNPEIDKNTNVYIVEYEYNKNALFVEKAGGQITDITRLTWYIKDKKEYLARQREVGQAYRRILGKHFPAMTMVVVVDLIEDDALVEIEATAVLQR